MPFIAVQSSDEKEIVQRKTNSLHFFKFCGNFYLFDCLSAFFALQYGVFVPGE